jgi:uncharacterized membrane protein YhaH (DUF805 family)
MFSAVFSFRGRLNRLQYFLGSWGLGVAMIVLVVILLASVGGMARGGTPNPTALIKLGVMALLALLVIAPIYSWISFSLQARRFRDIGWEPVFVIPAWMVFGVLDHLAVMGAPQIAVAGRLSGSWLGLLVNLALGLCLPGKKAFDVAGVFDDVPPSGQPTSAGPAAPAAARAQPVAAPAGFGRRGLQVR